MTKDQFESLQFFDGRLLYEFTYKNKVYKITNDDTLLFEGQYWNIIDRQKEFIAFQHDDEVLNMFFSDNTLHIKDTVVDYQLGKEKINDCYISSCGKILSAKEVCKFDNFLLSSFFFRKYNDRFPNAILQQVTLNTTYSSKYYDWYPRFEFSSTDEVDVFCKVLIEFQVKNSEVCIVDVQVELVEHPFFQQRNNCNAVTERKLQPALNKQLITIEFTPEEIELLHSIFAKLAICSSVANKISQSNKQV